MGIRRTKSSGKKDSLGREIKVSEQQGQRAADNPMDSRTSMIPMGDFTSVSSDGTVVHTDRSQERARHEPLSTADSRRLAAEIPNMDTLGRGRAVSRLSTVGNPSDCYMVAAGDADLEDFQRDALQDRVLSSGDPALVTAYARDVDGADIEACQDVVLSSHVGAHAAYQFAAEISGSDPQALGEKVIDAGDPALARQFARDVPGADIDALQQVALRQWNRAEVERFVEQVNWADPSALDKI